MKIRIGFHFQDAASSEPDAIITDAALIPLPQEIVVTDDGCWVVHQRYFALRESPPTVRLLLRRSTDAQIAQGL